MQSQEHEYDIIGHPQLNFSFVVVFPFHPYTDARPGGEASTQPPEVCLAEQLEQRASFYFWPSEGLVESLPSVATFPRSRSREHVSLSFCC